MCREDIKKQCAYRVKDVIKITFRFAYFNCIFKISYALILERRAALLLISHKKNKLMFKVKIVLCGRC